jgi:predicted HicB family RNase H-like nuclease
MSKTYTSVPFDKEVRKVIRIESAKQEKSMGEWIEGVVVAKLVSDKKIKPSK